MSESYDTRKAILGIDPGRDQSGWIIYRPGHREPFGGFGIEENDAVALRIGNMVNSYGLVVVEMVASHGAIIGSDVLKTAVWIGEFRRVAKYCSKECVTILRRTAATTVTKIQKPNDSSVRAALIQRFGPPGKLHSPGPTYGIVEDIWSALCVAVAYTDKNVSQPNVERMDANAAKMASLFGGDV